MNNLNDISLKPEASALLGYTQEELEHYFLPFIKEFCATKKYIIICCYGGDEDMV